MSANSYLDKIERRKLENAKVGIAGAGGLGSNAAMLFVRAGLKNLVIADFDIVEESNLNRQFFVSSQIGQKKTAALAENLCAIESRLNLELHDVRLTRGNIADVFAGCQIIVEAFDSAQAKSMLLEELLPLGKTVISASGLAGWGRSNEIITRRVGKNLILVGDQKSDVRDNLPPVGVRVMIAAAHEANAVCSLLLGEEL